MMGKNSTTSQLDFLLFEEVSNEAAETISGGVGLTLGGSQELDLGNPLTMPFDSMTSLIGSISTLAGALGLTLPALPTPDLPKLPDPKELLPNGNDNGYR
ncbi:hypothetical protein IQ255_12290 [Pleurocapsales cyanobacterium LEGE 10410]|nr:hypothetical protein [Pleurocapsales cyanobacterium LEGE 10410]